MPDSLALRSDPVLEAILIGVLTNLAVLVVHDLVRVVRERLTAPAAAPA